jgi:hypothetical protein
LTGNEFGISIFLNVNNDGLLKDNVNLSSRSFVMMRFCDIVLADVYNNEYMIGGF